MNDETSSDGLPINYTLRPMPKNEYKLVMIEPHLVDTSHEIDFGEPMCSSECAAPLEKRLGRPVSGYEHKPRGRVTTAEDVRAKQKRIAKRRSKKGYR